MTIQSAEDLNSKLTELEEALPSFDGVENSLWDTSSLCKVLLTESGATSKPIKITRAAKRFTPDNPFYLDSIDFYSEDPLKLPNNITVTVKPLENLPYPFNSHQHPKVEAHNTAICTSEIFANGLKYIQTPPFTSLYSKRSTY